jgi:hypothetical protein
MGHFRSPCYSRYHIRYSSSRDFFCCHWGIIRISDPVTAQYIGFILHVITGMAAGNVFGQISVFWSKMAPYNDSFASSAPNQFMYNIAGHFNGLYPVIIGGSLVFHLIYGTFTGFVSGRMTELGTFIKVRNNTMIKP